MLYTKIHLTIIAVFVGLIMLTSCGQFCVALADADSGWVTAQQGENNV